MSFTLVPSSPAMAEAKEHESVTYPFEDMEIGQSFTVAFADANEVNLRTAASRASKRFSKKFKVVKHSEYSCYEVGRVE